MKLALFMTAMMGLSLYLFLSFNTCNLEPYTDHCLGCVDCLDSYQGDVPERGETL